MSEEIKKEAQDTELKQEDMHKVSGGYVIHNDDPMPSIFCSKCGAEMIKKGMTTVALTVVNNASR